MRYAIFNISFNNFLSIPPAAQHGPVRDRVPLPTWARIPAQHGAHPSLPKGRAGREGRAALEGRKGAGPPSHRAPRFSMGPRVRVGGCWGTETEGPGCSSEEEGPKKKINKSIVSIGRIVVSKTLGRCSNHLALVFK